MISSEHTGFYPGLLSTLSHPCLKQQSSTQKIADILLPRDPITLSEDDWGVQSPPKRKVFRFHDHSQKVSQDPLSQEHFILDSVFTPIRLHVPTSRDRTIRLLNALKI